MKSARILLLFLLVPFMLSAAKPNFIIIFADDQGYNDLSCFGSEKIKTPHIDRMAKEGRKFTNFHVASPVCSPSRAALLTGSYPKRVGMHKHVLFPRSNYGLNPEEFTIADMFKGAGYATACIGKWHLGHHPELLPRQNGFDYYYGIPYSNDMNHPDNKGKPNPKSDESWQNQDEWVKKWNTPLIENEEIIELPCDQRTITRRYTDKAIDFVRTNKDKPFFLYLPHSMPHIPLFVPEDVEDPDPLNAYTCTIEHIDAEVGRLMDTVRELGLSETTYVIYTSDNGPWLPMAHHGGSADPLREGKGTTFEGGQRVPCVMWAPGRIPASTESDAFTATMDIMPTFARLAGIKLPDDLKIDGFDISKLMKKDAKSPRKEMLYYTKNGDLQGIYKDGWKYLGLDPKQTKKKKGLAKPEIMLFHLDKDMRESDNLLDQYPEKVVALEKRMKLLDEEVTANARSVLTLGDEQVR